MSTGLWTAVEADLLCRAAEAAPERLNDGQRASLCAIAARIGNNGILIADEVGMGKTRIAVEVASSVVRCGGRVAVLVPPGLGYQWKDELREGGLGDVPDLLRSLWSYLEAWESDETGKQRPWFDQKLVLISHAFSSLQVRKRAPAWRWGLLPELYSLKRQAVGGRALRTTKNTPKERDPWVRRAAESILKYVTDRGTSAQKAWFTELLSNPPDRVWSRESYSRDAPLDGQLRSAIGLGLGAFDLIIIDEAHKARGMKSGLSRLIGDAGLIYESGRARRLAMTATPVELEANDWAGIFKRIGIPSHKVTALSQLVEKYAEAARRLRREWRFSPEALASYREAASEFQSLLSPYVLRRDKREDPAVRAFMSSSSGLLNYREEHEISIDATSLSHAWQESICAAEALSFMTGTLDDEVTRRLRLTTANGHGLASMLDLARARPEEHEADLGQATTPDRSTYRAKRAAWWLSALESPAKSHDTGDEFLFDHPGIAAAVEAIEEQTANDEKVLVFGRFTRPLRALAALLNAREMFRRLGSRQHWPQSKVRGSRGDSLEHSDWPAVEAAHRQLSRSGNETGIELSALDSLLADQYAITASSTERMRNNLVTTLAGSLTEARHGKKTCLLFQVFRHTQSQKPMDPAEDTSALALLSRALLEHLGDEAGDATPEAWADAFSDVIGAMTDKQDAFELNASGKDANILTTWKEIEDHLRDIFSSPAGGFARLMYGATQQKTRRMMQLAFNRKHSFPRVLVAQSMVGREGLNLHGACRTVVLLHPEWNPGVVEQQIGRVDRVGSWWSQSLDSWLRDNGDASSPATPAPRITIRPVIFRGTYDEHHWAVLQERWDDLRSQLHGIVVPTRLAGSDQGDSRVLAEIAGASPNFSPPRLGQAGNLTPAS